MIGTLLLVILAAAALVALLLAGGLEALLLGLAVLMVLALALIWAHHRHRLAEIHEADRTQYRGFRRVNTMIHWPKYCLRCGMTVSNRTQVRIHLGYNSACARLRQADEEELEREAPAETLRVLEVNHHHGAHEYDSFTDDPGELGGNAGELEAQERT